MGIFLGTISSFNLNKGRITIETHEPIEIGDTISIESEQGTYTVSEILPMGTGFFTIGRMKGNFKKGLKVYKMSSKSLDNLAISSYSNVENKKIPLNCKLEMHLNEPVKISISTINCENSFYNNINFEIVSDIIPELALNSPISENRIKSQLMKTTNTPYEFKDIKINMDNNLYIPHIADINNLRRTCLEKLENIIVEKYCNKHIDVKTKTYFALENTSTETKNIKISILLNKLSLSEDYSLLKNVDRIYIPLKYFFNASYSSMLNVLCKNFEIYIYLPLIMKENYKKLLYKNLKDILNSYNIKGFIISNIGNLDMLKTLEKKYNFIGNYSLNVFNNFTAFELNQLGINTITLSPELNENDYNNFSHLIDSEFIVYGNMPIMNINYCPLSKNNKCLKDCKHYCMKKNKYYLIDRLNFKFEIIPDSIDCITTIYNSKKLSIMPSNFKSSFRLDFISENIQEINAIVNSVKNGKKIEGQNFTNGNWFREV